MIGAAVACTAGAVSASLSAFSPPKTSAAYPFEVGLQQSEPVAPAATAPPVAPTKTPLPPLRKHSEAGDAAGKTPSAGVVSAASPVDISQTGIPALALMAYRRAADEQAIRTPGCHLPWTLLAAIGKVESNHARGGALTDEGFTASPILGPVLNGGPFAALHDSDQGKLDGDTTWDRAVGPMQFIPSTWKRWGITTRPVLAADPNNIFDASTSAAAYLCANNRDLNDPLQLNQAILSYNPSQDYLRDVLALNSAYASGRPDVVDAAAVPAVAHGPSDQTDSQSGPAVPAVSPAVAANTTPQQGAAHPRKEIASPPADTKGTSQKQEQRPATIARERQTALRQPPQVSASPSVTATPPVQDLAPAPEQEPARAQPAVVEAGLHTPKEPSSSPLTTPRLGQALSILLSRGDVPAALGRVLPAGAERS